MLAIDTGKNHMVSQIFFCKSQSAEIYLKKFYPHWDDDLEMDILRGQGTKPSPPPWGKIDPPNREKNDIFQGFPSLTH